MTELRESLVSNRPPLTSLLIIFIVVFIGYVIVGPMVGLAIAMMLYSGDLLSEVISSSPSPEAFTPFMVLQGIVSLIAFVVLPMLYIRFTEQKPISNFFKTEKNLPLVTILLFVLGVSFVLALSPITEWNTNLEFPEALKGFGEWARAQEDKLAEMTKFLTNFDSFRSFLLGLIVIAVIPAVGEEFVFRGLIQHELWRSSRNIHVAIWVSAILFSAIHMQFFGFLPRMFLGVLFGYLYYWSGNLLIPVIGHFINNGFMVTMVYLQQVGVSPVDMEDETAAPLSMVIICAVATFTLLYFFKKRYSTHSPAL